jgi:hypothetical protein
MLMRVSITGNIRMLRMKIAVSFYAAGAPGAMRSAEKFLLVRRAR